MIPSYMIELQKFLDMYPTFEDGSKKERSHWGLDFGHSLSAKVIEGEGRTLKALSKILGDLIKTFDKIEYTIIPRAQNLFEDALATLASMVEILEGVWTQPLEIE